MQLSPIRLALACWTALHISTALAIGPHDARNGDECRAQVMANYEALAAKAAAGNTRALTSSWNRRAAPEMEQCERMDRAVRETRMRKAHERMGAAITTLREDGVVRAEELRWLRQEYEAIVAFPHAPYRDAVVATHAELLRYASAPRPGPAACAAITQALTSARAEHDRAVDALLAKPQHWRIEEQVRQASLAEMQFQRYQARRAGCATR